MKVQSAMEILSPYLASGFENDPTQAERQIKKAYRRAAMASHPDQGGDGTTDMVKVNLAMEALSSLSGERLVNLYRAQSNLVQMVWRKDDPQNCELYHSQLPSFKTRSELLAEAFKIRDGFTVNDLLNIGFGTWYVNDGEHRLKVQIWHGCLAITDLTNALRHRQTCKQVVFSMPYGDNNLTFKVMALAEQHKLQTLHQLLEFYWLWLVETQDWKEGTCYRIDLDGDGKEPIDVRWETRAGNTVFSPWSLERLKPLTSKPKKWTYPHLVRALANGQFRQLYQSYRYTDDYAHDAAMNYGRQMLNPYGLVEDLVRNKSSCRNLFDRGGEISFGNHMNDSKSLVFELSNRFPVVSLESNETLQLH